jgi:TonB family protein
VIEAEVDDDTETASERPQVSPIRTESSSISDDQRERISSIQTSTPTSSRTTSTQPEEQRDATQSQFESLEELTENRRPIGDLAEPEIPEDVKRGGRQIFEVVVSFELTDGGIVRNVEFVQPPESRDLERNIRQALLKWTFVPANESVTVRLKYVIEVR